MPDDEPRLTVLLLTHDALRRDLARLQAAAPGGATDGLRDYFSMVNDFLTHHHEVEDRHVWPGLRSKVGADGARVLDDMEAEHQTIDPLLARVSAAVESGGSADLPTEMDAFAEAVTAHLAHEERDAIPLMRRHFTIADEKRVGDAARKEAGLRSAARFFPWLLDEADPALVADLKSQLPRPLWWLAQGPWRRRHEKLTAALGR